MIRAQLAVLAACGTLFFPAALFAAEPPKAPAATPPALPPALQKAQAALDKGDTEAAIKLLRAEADKGDAIAANALGEIHIAGRGVKASPAEALKWFQKAADAGNAAGQFNLARLLFIGAEGVPKDEEKSRFLLRTSAEAGYPPAQAQLGGYVESLAARSENKAQIIEAREWYEKAAAQGQPDALLALARYYDGGLGGLEVSAEKAFESCFRASKAGSVVAMNEMAVRYQKGAGIRQDSVAAIGWFTLAAQHGLPAALVNLGNCYETGNGVRQDFDQAGRNYSAAAKQNFGPAEFLLGQMIEQGKGTAVNLAHAYVLYTRAGAQKNEEAAKRAEAIKAKLTPAQLEEAAKLLRSGAVP